MDRLLERFEVLRGLVVRETASTNAEVLGLLRSVAPGELGLPCGKKAGADWELFRGGLLYAANALEPAHAIFQENHSAEGSYWHGMLHRREGDFPNALYWIRRAGRVPGVSELGGFSPAAFISECAAAAGRGEEPPRLLETQRREWDAMLLWSWQRLSAPA